MSEDDEPLLMEVSNTPRYNAELKSFLNYGTLPVISERPHVMQYIQRLKSEAALQGDYDEAERYSQINAQFYQACISSESKRRTQEQDDMIEDRYQRTIMNYADNRRDWDQKISEAKQIEEKKLESLKEKHIREIQEFNEKWSSEPAVRQFAKPSSELQDTLYRHKMSVLAKDYEFANKSRSYAQELETNESQKAYILAQKKVQIKKEELLRRQQEELDRCLERAKLRIYSLKLQREQAIKIAHQHINHAEQVKYRHDHSRRSDAEIICQMRSDALDTFGQCSPRTHQKMLNFRKSQNIPILRLHPIQRGAKTPMRPNRVLSNLPKY